MSFIKEFCEFLKVRKKYWLLPIIIVLILFGGLIIRNQINKPINIITHTFSHFKLILDIYALKIIDSIDTEGEWIELNEAFTQLPSLMKKVAHTV